MDFCHYLYGDPASSEPREATWASVRVNDGYTEPLDDIVKYISFGNDGVQKLKNHGYSFHNPLDSLHIRPGPFYLDEEDNSIPYDKDGCYEDYICVNTYIRLFRMCYDSLYSRYPDVDVDFSPNMHLLCRDGRYLFDSGNDLYPNGSKRFCDIQYISTRRIAELSDSISPITGRSYVGHYSGNMWHSKGKGNLWNNVVLSLTDTVEVFPDNYSGNSIRDPFLGRDDCASCNDDDFLLAEIDISEGSFVYPIFSFNPETRGYDGLEDSDFTEKGKGYFILASDTMTNDSCFQFVDDGELLWEYENVDPLVNFRTRCSPTLDDEGNVYYFTERTPAS